MSFRKCRLLPHLSASKAALVDFVFLFSFFFVHSRLHDAADKLVETELKQLILDTIAALVLDRR